MRGLIDTGSQLTILNESVFQNMRVKPLLNPSKVVLNSANGSSLQVKGEAEITFKIRGMKLTHKFVIVSDLSRSVILGRDFLVKTKAKIMFDIGKICINGVYVPLERDSYIMAVVSTIESIELKPRTTYLIGTKLEKPSRAFGRISRNLWFHR